MLTKLLGKIKCYRGSVSMLNVVKQVVVDERDDGVGGSSLCRLVR